MLRVSSGILRGILLRSPSGKGTRPSTERVRQAIFNVLRNKGQLLQGAVVVDLFAGTGAWGIEALSNGAGQAWFVESAAGAIPALRANLAKAASCFESQALVVPGIHCIQCDVASAFHRLPAATIIACDPPYGKDWFQKIVDLEQRFSKIVPGGILVFEAATRDQLDIESAEGAGLKLGGSKIYGDSAVHFFVKLPA